MSLPSTGASPRTAEDAALEEAAALEHIDTNSPSALKKPRRRMTAYNFYFQDARPKLIASNPDMEGKVTEQAKTIGTMWRALSDEARAPFTALAEEDDVRYEAEIAVYIRQRTQLTLQQAHRL